MLNAAIKRAFVLFALVALSLTSCTDDWSDSQLNSYDDSAVSGTMWREVRGDFKLPDVSRHPRVREQIRWFQQHPKVLEKLTSQAGPYLYYVHSEVSRRHIPGELALLPMIESAYDPYAYSSVGAAGLWQIMPGTATGFGLKQDWWYDGRRDIHNSTKAALDYLTYLSHYFNQDWLLAIAAYDSGEGKVQQALIGNSRFHMGSDYWSLPLPRETELYVPRLMALVAIIRNPNRYHVVLPRIENEPYFQKVNVGFQLDLQQASKLSEVPLRELSRLNPGYNHLAMAPVGPYSVVLPIDHVEIFKEHLALLPKNERLHCKMHITRENESLVSIAKRYQTNVATLERVNNLASAHVAPGRTIVIPDKKITMQIVNGLSQHPMFLQGQHATGPIQTVYRTREGDTYETVARRYQVKPSAIKFWNHLSYRGELPIGIELTLWTPLSRRQLAMMDIEYYFIRRGDTIRKIARRLHLNPSKLRKQNHLASLDSHLIPGAKLEVPTVVG